MRKGVDLTLGLMAQVFREVTNAELCIVGQRHSQKDEAIEYERQLHQFAAANFENGRVKWLGRRDDIPELMRNADLLVHGAKQEPLGRVLLEAAASGLPMVTTNVGGTPEIVDGLEQLMYPPANFDAAIPTAIDLLTDCDKHRKISEALRRIAEQKFSADRAGDDLAQCYLNAVA
jgi:glycosyltransferase involved in cell wall biosynthesis